MGQGCSAPAASRAASGQTHHAGLSESWLQLGKWKFSCGNSGRLEQHCPAAPGFLGPSELMASVSMVQRRCLSCTHPTGTPAQFWVDPSSTGCCVPVSHPAPPAAEGGFQRGMEVLLVGEWCCGLNHWGLGVWGRMRCGGLDCPMREEHQRPHWVMPWGWEWWHGPCHPPSLHLDHPFPLQLARAATA